MPLVLIYDNWEDDPSAAFDLILKHARKIELSERIFSLLVETITQKKGALQTKAVNCLFELLNVKATESCLYLRCTRLLADVELTREITELLVAYLSKAKAVYDLPTEMEQLKMKVEYRLAIETDLHYRNRLGTLLQEIYSESQREATLLDRFVI